jgi:F-type H+-transporting ATPase subunit b
LRELAGRNLEEQIARVFIGRLRELNGAEKMRLTDFVTVSGRPIIVRSAFALPAPERAEIEQTVRETLVPAARVEFEEAPDLLGGIELASDGHKIAWSIGDYLTSLEDTVRDFIDQKPGQDDERE